MKRLLMLAALGAFGAVGCKGNDHDSHVRNDMPMIGAQGKAATQNGQVVQTQYRPTGSTGVQQAGGMNASTGSVVPAVAGANTACPNGMCPNTRVPMNPSDPFNNPIVR